MATEAKSRADQDARLQSVLHKVALLRFNVSLNHKQALPGNLRPIALVHFRSETHDSNLTWSVVCLDSDLKCVLEVFFRRRLMPVVHLGLTGSELDRGLITSRLAPNLDER